MRALVILTILVLSGCIYVAPERGGRGDDGAPPTMMDPADPSDPPGTPPEAPAPAPTPMDGDPPPEGSTSMPAPRPLPPPLALTRLERGQCRALAPSGWSMAAFEPWWSADLYGPAGRYAGYGILGIDRAMEGWYADHRGDLHGPPEASMLYLANAIIEGLGGDGSSARYTSEATPLGRYAYRSFEAPGFRGIVVHRLFDTSGGPYVDGEDYVEVTYFAVTRAEEWDAEWESVMRTALSIRCTAAYRTPSGSEIRSEDGSSEDAYNRWLETEYVHDSTCTNYLVSDANWLSDGPAGPGYYRTVGTDYERLAPGRCE